jgi:hypothetical protein
MPMACRVYLNIFKKRKYSKSYQLVEWKLEYQRKPVQAKPRTDLLFLPFGYPTNIEGF